MQSPPDDLSRIYALIELAVAETDPEEFDRIMKDLQAVLRGHIQRIRTLALSSLALRRKSENLEDR